MTATIPHTALADAERAARATAVEVRAPHALLVEVAPAMVELGDPAAPRVLGELEACSPENRAYLASLHARRGDAREVVCLGTSVRQTGLDASRRQWLVTAFELIGDIERADDLVTDRSLTPDERADCLYHQMKAALELERPTERGRRLARTYLEAQQSDPTAGHRAVTIHFRTFRRR